MSFHDFYSGHWGYKDTKSTLNPLSMWLLLSATPPNPVLSSKLRKFISNHCYMHVAILKSLILCVYFYCILPHRLSFGPLVQFIEVYLNLDSTDHSFKKIFI